MRKPTSKTDASFVIALLVEAWSRGTDEWAEQCVDAIHIVQALVPGMKLDEGDARDLKGLEDYLSGE